MTDALTSWLATHLAPGASWFAKRLSGNDTLANRTHQAGPYIPKPVLFRFLPELDNPYAENPDRWFTLYLDSHDHRRNVRAIWYNQLTRNEARVTNFGGGQSPLLRSDNTGALTVFAFGGLTEPECHVWVCRTPKEEDLVEERIGVVHPGRWRVYPPFSDAAPLPTTCRLTDQQIPEDWRFAFPRPEEILDLAVSLCPGTALTPDKRLLRRRKCEYDIFRSVESALALPVIREGFENFDDFLDLAQSITQRRKARSGRSLELQVKKIFSEYNLVEGRDFSYNQQSEPGHRPDFLFPSVASYRNTTFPNERLRMLAIKSTCKDRWRQILNEAHRIGHKHLLTLLEGISENQFCEMTEADVQLVVPETLHRKFARTIRPRLQTLASFLDEIRSLRVDT